ncbi:MAG TPA: hypothetical protein VGI54_07765 [Solirubrobacteraceae bacterium]|jgi:hypothetical protein
MAAGTAHAGAPPAAAGRPRAGTARLGALARATSITRVEAACILLCLALAGLTLLFPTTPTYDPWSWIVWGRQILHGSLDTVEGPSWKPLPIFFTIPFSVFGAAAPNLWVVVARAGAMLSLGAAFAVARRLVGRGWAGVFAGLFAAFALLTSLDYVRLVALGNSEGLLVLVLLVGIDRHLQGRYRHAFFFAFLAGLLRPEAWPFLLVYGAWVLYHERAWLYVGGLGAATVFLWLAPERWGSGNFFRAADRATDPTEGSAVLALDPHPFSAVLTRAEQDVWVPVLVGLGLAAAAGLIGLVRRRSGLDRRLLFISGACALWVLLVAAMTAAGFSGNPRYLVAPAGVACAAAGAGWGVWLRALERIPRLGRAATALAVAAAVGVGAWIGFAQDGYVEFRGLTDNLRYQYHLRADVPPAIARAGGRRRIIDCGRIATNKYQVPMLSWYLHVPGEYLKWYWLPRGYMFQTRPSPGDQPDPIPGPDNHYLGKAGLWDVYDGACKTQPAGPS